MIEPFVYCIVFGTKYLTLGKNSLDIMIDTTIFQDKKVVFYTLGCKLNFAETSTLGQILAENGIRKARPGEEADLCVINTCSVTDVADHKCRQIINRLVRNNPGAFVVVTFTSLSGSSSVTS